MAGMASIRGICTLSVVSALQLLASRQILGAELPTPRQSLASLALTVRWKEPPHEGELTDAKRRVSQDTVATPGVSVTVYGPCKDDSGNAGQVEAYETPDIAWLWNGLCLAPVAITVSDPKHYFDMTGPGKVRWTMRTGSLHEIRPVLRLADGTLLVGDHVDSTTTPPGQFVPLFIGSEISLATVKWCRLNPDRVVTLAPVSNPDLSKVEAIGFADLMPGGGGHLLTGGINVADVEIYGKLIPR